MKRTILFLHIIYAIAIPARGGLGEPVKQIETIRDVPGKMYLFTLGADNQVYYARQYDRNAEWTSGMPLSKNQSAYTFLQIGLTLAPEGTVVVYALGRGGALFFCSQSVNNPDQWSAWATVPGFDFLQISCIKNNKQQLFVLNGKDKSVSFNYMKVTSYRAAEGSRNWNGWENLGGWNLKQIVSGSNSSGTNVVLALSNDGSVYQNRGGSGNWQGWNSLGGSQIKKIDLGENYRGLLICYAIGGDGALYETHETDAAGNWSGWQLLGNSTLADICSGLSVSGRATACVLHNNGNIEMVGQNDPGGTAWGFWASMGNPNARLIKCGTNADGRLELFAVGNNGRVYHRWEIFDSNAWFAWVEMN